MTKANQARYLFELQALITIAEQAGDEAAVQALKVARTIFEGLSGNR